MQQAHMQKVVMAPLKSERMRRAEVISLDAAALRCIALAANTALWAVGFVLWRLVTRT